MHNFIYFHEPLAFGVWMYYISGYYDGHPLGNYEVYEL